MTRESHHAGRRSVSGAADSPRGSAAVVGVGACRGRLVVSACGGRAIRDALRCAAEASRRDCSAWASAPESAGRRSVSGTVASRPAAGLPSGFRPPRAGFTSPAGQAVADSPAGGLPGGVAVPTSTRHRSSRCGVGTSAIDASSAGVSGRSVVNGGRRDSAVVAASALNSPARGLSSAARTSRPGGTAAHRGPVGGLADRHPASRYGAAHVSVSACSALGSSAAGAVGRRSPVSGCRS